jgi:hypothetical protein
MNVSITKTRQVESSTIEPSLVCVEYYRTLYFLRYFLHDVCFKAIPPSSSSSSSSSSSALTYTALWPDPITVLILKLLIL